VPTADEIAEAAATTAADGVQSAMADGQSATAIDPLKQLDVADRIAKREALTGNNPQGGPRSGWGLLRPARVVPPGAV
jgi:hypothetical protein